jgi:DNA-directed RNA polymerase subunit M/transcription elongation factor TFIIS
VRRQISEPSPYLPLYPQARNEPLNNNKILENWRKSILGLIKLAENNLQRAEFYITTMNYKEAVDAAATSIENISRALLHCYGEKPDPNSCQEEPLRIVARRLQVEERARFEKAVDEAVQIYRNKIFGTCLLENGVQISFLNEARTRQTVEIATKIVVQFRQIIEEHFGTEIAELSEKCPKCGALSISLWAFNIQGATYQCNICSHKWTQPCNT